MPDQTVTIQVTFDANDEPVWPTVSPIRMTGAGTIRLRRARHSRWIFSGFEFYAPENPNTPTYPPDFGTPEVHGHTIQITDRDTTQGRYFFRYRITTKTRPHTSHWSPDPEIDNDP